MSSKQRRIVPGRANSAPAELVTIDDLKLEWALERAERPVEVVSAQYLRRDGALVYAVPLADQLALVASDGSVTLPADSATSPTRVTFSPAGIRRFRRGQHLDLAEVIDRVRGLLVAHVRFAEDWQPMLVSLWVVGTYLHVLFAFFGYLHITSASKRCGKSLLLDILSYLCFNATRITTDPTPAFLFRDAERNCGTQLFDEVEWLTDSSGRSRAAPMAMLNAGFKRGSRVSRVTAAKTDSFREFNVYAPRVLASIRGLSTTVADRCLRIELVRKHRDERVEKFTPRRQGSVLSRLRDDLHLAALQHARQVGACYERAEQFPVPDDVDDRLRDILEPLFAIATVADNDKGIAVHIDAMMEAAKALAAMRLEDDADDAALVAALTALEGICTNGTTAISTNGALALFQTTEGLEWVDSKDKARALLRRLGFHSAIHRRERFREKDRPDSGRITARGYEIRRESVLDRRSRYSSDSASHASRCTATQRLRTSI